MNATQRLDEIEAMLATVDSNREDYERAIGNARHGLPTNELTNLNADEYRLAVSNLKAAAPYLVRAWLPIVRAAMALNDQTFFETKRCDARHVDGVTTLEEWRECLGCGSTGEQHDDDCSVVALQAAIAKFTEGIAKSEEE